MTSPAKKYSLIVFDWDGTLMDSASGIAACIQEASREMGLKVPSDEQARHVIGLGLQDSLRFAVPDLPLEGYPEFVELYRKHFRVKELEMTLFPGVPELLDGLRHAGHRLAIATGKSRRGLDRALATCGLEARFVASRCADETTPKPAPDMLRELMHELAVSSDRTLMIGDTSHDLGMATSAGVDAVGVTYGAHPEDSLRALLPRGLVGSIAELDAWLAAHG
jgi:phosphoglycolate phosphatase